MTLQTFHFEGTPVRDVLIDGDPWWVASDVCACLGLTNSRQAVADMPDDEKRIIDLRNTVSSDDGIQRGNPEATAVNEPGLYRLIFKSRKPEAERFKRWVLHEVLPQIRRTGSFQAQGAVSGQTVPMADYVALQDRMIALQNVRIEELQARTQKKTGKRHSPPLSNTERATIARMAREGATRREIAMHTGRSSSVITAALHACPPVPEDDDDCGCKDGKDSK